MPKLKCDAKNCIYNCGRYCAKSVIHINDDLDAKKCESFSEKKYDTNEYNTEFANLDGCNQYVSIECRAKECDHNSNGMCVSEHVKIGKESATTVDETKCETFSD